MEGSTNSSTSHDVPNTKLREQFVQDLNGTSMEEVILFSSQIPLLIFVVISLELYILNKFNINMYKSVSVRGPIFLNAIVIFFLETATVILPLIFLFTVFSDNVHIFLLSVISIILFIITFSVSSPDNSVLYWKLPYLKTAPVSDYVSSNKQPFITYFRALVFLMTSISILGVDFHTYPRRFAKTETFGVSIMDLGVGMFIISSALVAKTNVGFAKGIKQTLLETLVFLVLGTARYFLIQRLDYQKHVTEYGVHWNFFITLAFVKLFSFLILSLLRGYSFFCGLVLMLIHQYLLFFSLEAYVIGNEDRTDLLKANREGIVSLCGYISLYLLGVAIASYINSQLKKNDIKNKLKILLFLVVASMCFFIITYYVNNKYFEVSRRMANLPFITWTLAISLTVLSVSLVTELLSLCFLPMQPHFKDSVYFLITPTVLESINYNGLLFFLISNLLTGFVNLYIDVLKLSTSSSLLILVTYTVVNSATSYVLYLKNIKIKFW